MHAVLSLVFWMEDILLREEEIVSEFKNLSQNHLVEATGYNCTRVCTEFTSIIIIIITDYNGLLHKQ